MAMVASAVEAKRALGPILSSWSNHLNWSKVFCAQAVVADKMISDFFFAEIYELEDEELAVGDAARVVHVRNLLNLDPASS